MKRSSKALILGMAISGILFLSYSPDKPASAETTVSGAELIQQKCAACHQRDKDGKLDRIDAIRKTPEGWDSTIKRMKRLWGLAISDEEARRVVKELSDTRGLAPEETAMVEDWILGESNRKETAPNDNVRDTCTRCHTLGRIVAERRTPEEWKKLKGFHLGILPSLVLSQRDIDWVNTSDQALNDLAKAYPYDTTEWKKWSSREKTGTLSGTWRVVGHQTGKGDYEGTVEFLPQGNDEFKEVKKVRFADGAESAWEGTARIYTGYAVRGSLAGGKEKATQELNLAADGKSLTGQWRSLSQVQVGGKETMFKEDGQRRIAAVYPKALPAGAQGAVLTLFGTNLKDLTAGDIARVAGGLTVTEVTATDEGRAQLKVNVGNAVGLSPLSVKQNRSDVTLGIYPQADYLKVTPDFGLSRIGGTTAAKQAQQFEATAFSNGADGQAGTDDDIEIGLAPATWELQEYASTPDDDDVKFVGTIDSSGLFTPANDGPNPQRTLSTNNAGSVTVVAHYQRPDGKTLDGKSHLLVTVPVYRGIQ
ncbi:quinohemoprotein amine dehydrogenase subunit alpha [Heliobacterium gestii]|uniref:Quinohemoprotein amine dehydrogenase subunit alpha n=1 Tax=Heliomicrobium gestii TaxID=2699 RepID=A0A845LCA2_HELGE|nr:quinohemoprotein amine dehydrogenase subunit alpha [Heliomicrobium gestii]MBM7866230.1 quinohemoprotein amine dehydrogenase [Heliomicrobium gestii]MZP42974.1 quinohemoprotein amine dehydrogenase subunit alpha [Heliomicrobium gestii]